MAADQRWDFTAGTEGWTSIGMTGLAAIYFTTSADPSFTGNYGNFSVSTGDTDFHECTVTMSGHAD